jgi:hypothetical protein
VRPLSRTQRLVIALATAGGICATGYWSAPSIIQDGSAFSRTILKVTFLPISLASEFNFFGSTYVMLFSFISACVLWTLLIYLFITFLLLTTRPRDRLRSASRRAYISRPTLRYCGALAARAQ